jgi:hypothetical protein
MGPISSMLTAALPLVMFSNLTYISLLQPEDQAAGIAAFKETVENRLVYVNMESRPASGPPMASLALDSEGKDDVARILLEDGLLLVENRRERRLKKMVSWFKFLYICLKVLMSFRRNCPVSAKWSGGLFYK